MTPGEPSPSEQHPLSNAPRLGLRYENLKLLANRLRQALPAKERLSPAQVKVLRWLVEHGCCQEGQLAKELGMSKQTVSSIVGALIRIGLSKPEFDKRDHRKHSLTATTRGKLLLGRIDQITEELQAASESSTREPSAVPVASAAIPEPLGGLKQVESTPEGHLCVAEFCTTGKKKTRIERD